MQLEFVQLDWEFITARAPIVASYAGIQDATAIGYGAKLFALAISTTGTKKKPPDGVFVDPDALTMFERVVGWTGEPGVLGAAFIRGGLVQKLEVGARVKGLERYAKTFKASLKAKKRKADWARSNREKDASVDVPERSTRRRGTREKEKEKEKDIIKPPPPTSSAPSSEQVVVEKFELEGHLYEKNQRGCWSMMQALRVANGLSREAGAPEGFADWFAAAISEAGFDGIFFAYRRFCCDDSVKARGKPTAVFITPGMWGARKLAAEDAA